MIASILCSLVLAGAPGLNGGSTPHAATSAVTSDDLRGSSASGGSTASSVLLPETGLGPAPVLTYCAPGADFDATGVTTRAVVTHPGVPPQTPVFVLTGPVAPAACTVVDVIAVWNWLLLGPPPPLDTIVINGTAVTGTLVGSGSPDLCWGKSGGAAYMVPGLVGIVTLGGPNTIAGATDKPLGGDPAAYGEGITLFVLYECPGAPARNVDIYAGYVSTESGAVVGDAAWSIAFTKPYVCGDLHLFLNAMDGQSPLPGFDDEFFVTGIPLGGVLPGTLAPGNAWQGLLGTPPGPPPVTDWLYDHGDGDLSLLIPLPALLPGLAFDTIRPAVGDCIGHSLMAVSFPTAVATAAFFNGGGGNPPGYSAVTSPVLGGAYVATVVLPPGHVASVIAFTLGGAISGPGLVGLISGQLLCLPPIALLNFAAGTHTVPIPLDCSLLGASVCSQAGTISLGPLHVTLNNAQLLTIGI